MNKKFLRILVFFIIAILIANATLLVLHKISELLFWAIIIIAALFAYKILPRMK